MRNVGSRLGVVLLAVLLAALPQPSRADVGLPGLRVLSSDATSLTVEYDLPGYQLVPVKTPGGTFTRVRVDGLAATNVVGGPELPAGGTWVALPPVGRATLHVIEDDVERVPAVDVMPVYKPDFAPDAQGALLPVRQYARDAAQYARAGVYPEVSAALEGEQWMRFQRVTALRLFPVRYEALSRTLVVSKRLVVRIDFTAPAPRAGLDALGAAGLQSAPMNDGAFEPVYGSAVVNYDAARAWRARPRPAATAVRKLGAARPLDTGTGNPEWRVRVDTTGVWRVSFAQLAAQQWPSGIATDQVVAFRRDTTANLEPVPWSITEVPIDVIDVNGNAVFDAGDFIVLPVQNWNDRVHPGWYERRYGDYDMVWLSYKSSGAGLRVAQAPSWLGAANPTRPVSFPSTHHYERNFHYFSFPVDVARDDQFHWTDGNDDRTPVDSILADLMDLDQAGGSVHVRAEWVGRSNLTHLLSADWVRGGDNLATTLWTDTAAFARFSFDAVKEFDAHNASEGLNRLRISGRIDTGPTGSQAAFNFFEVTYPRRYVARNNRLELNTGSATDTVEVTVSGFSGAAAPPIYVYDVTDSSNPVRLTVDPSHVAPSGGGWSVTLQTVAAPGVPRKLVAASDVAPLPDAAISRATPSSLYLTPSNGADFLIVTYDAFEPAVEPLADFRRQKGISTLVAKAQDIYDEFNNGRKSYFAVRRFLSYALTHWNSRFVLLVGDASEDAQGWLGTSDTDFLPVPVIHGPVGVAQGLEVEPSDNWYVLGLTGGSPDTDLLADMVLGRWTAGSLAEAQALTAKSIAYETATPLDAAWRNRAVLVADDEFSSQTTFGGGGGGFNYCERTSEGVFKAIDQTLEGLIRNEAGYKDFDIEPFYMSDIVTDDKVQPFTDPTCPDPFVGRDFETERQYVTNTVSPELFVLLNPGAAFLNFQGHGNAIQMTHEELWVAEGSLQDVDRIFNDNKPFFFSGYACHLNNFANIAERGFFGDGLGERMVNIPVKGAIASLASVGYELLPSIPTTQLNVHVYRAFFVNPPYAPFAGQSGARVFIGEAEVLGTYRMVATTFGLERLAARTYELLGDPLVAMNFGPPRFFAHATDRDSIASASAYYPTLDQDSVTVETKVLDESKLASLTITEQGEGARSVVPDSEITITPPYPDTVGNRYTIRLAVAPRPASYDVVFTAKDRSGLTGQFLLRFVLEARLTQGGQTIRSGDPVVPGTPLAWKVRSPARLASTDFVTKLDDTVIPFTAVADPTDTTGRTWTVTVSPALPGGSHKASLDVGLAKGGATRVVDFDVTGPSLAIKDVYAFPNPFRDRATFNFFVTSDQPSDVLVRVFTVNGTLVWERFEKSVPPGYHQWEWDGRDLGGKQVAYGTYLFRVASAQGGDRKAAEQGKVVRAPERKTTAPAATTP